MYRDIGVIKSGGIEICGLKLSLAPRRQQSQAAPKLEKYSFVPYTADKVICLEIIFYYNCNIFDFIIIVYRL